MGRAVLCRWCAGCCLGLHMALTAVLAAAQLAWRPDKAVDFTVGTNGEVKDVTVSRSSNAIFNAAATAAVARLRCTGQGHDVRVRVPFAFRLGN